MLKILDEVEFELLRQFQKYANGAVIAGGSVRDMFFGLPYNDVDIFYYNGSQPKNVSYCQLVDEVIPKIFKLTSKDNFKNLSTESLWEAPGSHRGQGVNRVVQLIKENGTKYQFISVETPVEKHIKLSFDLGCVKVYHDGLKLHRTKEFEEFQKTKLIEFFTDRPQDVSPVTIARVRKVENRYGPLGFKVGESFLNVLKWIEEHPPVKEKELPHKKARPIPSPTLTAAMTQIQSSLDMQLAQQSMNTTTIVTGAYLATNPFYTTNTYTTIPNQQNQAVQENITIIQEGFGGIEAQQEFNIAEPWANVFTTGGDEDNT